MPAYRITAWELPPSLVEVPVPVPAAGQVLVRVGACGLCHSDQSMMAMPASVGESLGWSIPFTLGHEAAGWVAAVGPGVSGIEVSAPVAVSSPSWCGSCRWCRAGRENACPAGLVGRGYGRDGSLAHYVLVDDVRALYPLGGLDPVDAAPLTDAGATSHHAVARVLPRLPDDGTAAVIGVGGLGGFVVQLLRALSPATVVAVDPDPVRRDVAGRYGANSVLSTVDDLGRNAVDVVVDLVGSDETIARGLRSLRAGGAFGLVGAAGGTLRRPWYGSLPRDGEVFTFQNSDRADTEAVLALAEAGEITVDTVRFGLDQVSDAYAALDAGSLAGRVVVEPGAEPHA